MTTYRVRRRSRYTPIHRDTINDAALSFRARGVLAWLLDKPDDWRADSEAIARAGKEGREAVRTALRELEAAGYLVRRKVQADGGRWVTEVEVHERPPESTTDAREPVVGDPSTDAQEPDARKADGRRAGPLTEGLKPTTETENDRESDPDALFHVERADDEGDDDPRTRPLRAGEKVPEFEFADWYREYPLRKGRGAAEQAYARARRKACAAELMAGAQAYAAESGRDPQFTAHPATWLNQERWSDEPTPRQQGGPRGGGFRDEGRSRVVGPEEL